MRSVEHQFPHLPNQKTRTAPAYLYAVEFHDGTVKVGVTWNPAGRIARLQRKYRRCATRAHAAPHPKLHRHRAERAVIAACGRIGTAIVGDELFTGVKFGEAANLVTQIARKHGDAVLADIDTVAHITAAMAEAA